jgi:two-component system, OmpR family, phosphate regulon response regulator PhoB
MAKKILIVDDEPDMVTFLTALLEDNGYETASACDGEEGLVKLKSVKPQMVTLDLLMPSKTGIKMFREMRTDEELKEIPVVMITGLGTGDIPQLDFKEWVQKRSIKPPEGYIEKPVNKEALLEMVRKAIGE